MIARSQSKSKISSTSSTKMYKNWWWKLMLQPFNSPSLECKFTTELELAFLQLASILKEIARSFLKEILFPGPKIKLNILTVTNSEIFWSFNSTRSGKRCSTNFQVILSAIELFYAIQHNNTKRKKILTSVFICPDLPKSINIPPEAKLKPFSFFTHTFPKISMSIWMLWWVLLALITEYLKSMRWECSLCRMEIMRSLSSTASKDLRKLKKYK